MNFENSVRKLPEPEFTGGTPCAVTAMSSNINFEKKKNFVLISVLFDAKYKAASPLIWKEDAPSSPKRWKEN